MAEKDKKYYWLKLKRDFFKRHDIRIIEEMPNGKDYILFYLKLLLESIDHEGSLRFSDSIPYNEQMLSVVTNTNIDIVRSAMKMFIELKMMDILDDQTIYMTEVNKLIGCETKWAEKKRIYREKKDNVLLVSSTCPNDVRQEIELEKDIEIDKELEQEKEIERDKDYLSLNNNINIDPIPLFQKVLAEVKKTVSIITYETFFENIYCKGLKGNKMLLSTSSNLFKDSINNNYSDKLVKAITTISEGQLVGYVWEV